jgi:hypothetical protein
MRYGFCSEQECYFRALFAIDENTYQSNNWTRLEDIVVQTEDFVEVQCRDRGKIVYVNMHIQVCL